MRWNTGSPWWRGSAPKTTTRRRWAALAGANAATNRRAASRARSTRRTTAGRPHQRRGAFEGQKRIAMNVRWQDHSRTIAECRAMLAASERLLRETWPDTFLGRQALIVP